MALYIPHSIFHLARLLYVRPETFGPYYIYIYIYIYMCINFTVVLELGRNSGKYMRVRHKQHSVYFQTVFITSCQEFLFDSDKWNT